MSGPQSYDEAPKEIRDAVEQLIKTYGPDPALLAGAIVSATCRAILAAKAEERQAIIQVCEAEKQAFLSPEYAAGQPMGSICERFAIDECIAAIRKRGEG